MVSQKKYGGVCLLGRETNVKGTSKPVELSMIEGAALGDRGTDGVLRIDLSEDTLLKMLSRKKNRLARQLKMMGLESFWGDPPTERMEPFSLHFSKTPSLYPTICVLSIDPTQRADKTEEH